jgi:hypothetical protein
MAAIVASAELPLFCVTTHVWPFGAVPFMVASVLVELVMPPPPSGRVPLGHVATAFDWVPAGFATSCDSTTR